MAHLRPNSHALLREYVGPAALGIALAVCMPLLGAAALVLRGTVVALVAVSIAIVATIAVWRLVEPTLSPRWHTAVCDYAAPVALAIALVISMPLLGIIALVVRGTVLALIAAALVIAAMVGLWRVLAGTHPGTRPQRPDQLA